MTARLSRLPLAAVEACWSSIGVYGQGDRTCPKLAQVVHCRSCPVLADGALTLLERPPAPRTEAEARALAEPAREEEQSAGSALVFRVGREWLAIRTEVCAFVSEQVAVRGLAGRSGAVFLGLSICRGEMTLAISLRGLLRIDAPPGAKRLWIAIGEEGRRWVFDADEIRGVIRFSDADGTNVAIDAVPSVTTFATRVLRIDGLDVGLLDDGMLDAAFRRSLES